MGIQINSYLKEFLYFKYFDIGDCLADISYFGRNSNIGFFGPVRGQLLARNGLHGPHIRFLGPFFFHALLHYTND